MPTNIPALTEHTGTLADDDVFVMIDTSAASDPKDRKIQASHLRYQLVRAVTSASDPTVNDDSADGFAVGNFWLNTSSGALFVLLDNTAGAADWDAFGTGISQSDVVQSFTIAVSDETTDLTTGNGKVTFRMPYAFTLTGVRASVTTAPTGAALQVDINESSASILSTVLSIDAGEKTSTTAATAAVISDSSLADDAEITIDIDQVGSTVAGAGLKVSLIGYRTT